MKIMPRNCFTSICMGCIMPLDILAIYFEIPRVILHFWIIHIILYIKIMKHERSCIKEGGINVNRCLVVHSTACSALSFNKIRRKTFSGNFSCYILILLLTLIYTLDWKLLVGLLKKEFILLPFSKVIRKYYLILSLFNIT